MIVRSLKLALMGAAMCGATLPLLAIATPAQAASGYNIERQDLGQALLKLAQAAGRNILFSPDLVRGRTSSAVNAAPSFDAALKAMLSGSDLNFQLENDGSATVLRKTKPNPKSAQPTVMARTDELSAAPVVDAVVVTARFRPEALESVPISVNVVDGAVLDRRNLHDLQGIASQVPDLTFRTSGTDRDRNIFIRGVGTITTSHGIEPSVAAVIDGVSLARSGQATIDVFDVDHIEVLRGPQGTLFGKNASAGVVNILTRNPTDHLTGYGEAEYFQGGEARFRAGVSGPLTDNMQGLLSAYTSKFDGNVKNLFNNSEVNGYRKDGFRAKIDLKPTDNLKGTFALDFSDSRYTTPFGVFVSTNTVAYPTGVVTSNAGLAANLATEGVIPSSTNRNVSVNAPSGISDRNGGGSFQLNWAMPGGFNLTSISAYRVWKDTQLLDFDQTSGFTAAILDGRDRGDFTLSQSSQEVRVASPVGNRVDYVLGAYYQRVADDERYERDLAQLVSGAPVQNNGVALYGTRNSNYALFGEMNAALTSRLKLTVGYRDIWDSISYYHNRVSTSPVDLPGVRKSFMGGPGSASQNGYSDRASLEYAISGENMIYASYARGYKGPGYNVFFSMQAFDKSLIAPETSNDYEVGIKGRLLDKTLRYSVTVFQTDYSNYTASFTDLVAGAFVNRVINAGSASTKGVELETGWSVTPDLRLNLSTAYDDAKVVQFNCPPGSPISCNINGKPLPFAPEFKSHLDFDYKHTLNANFNWDVETAYDWQSKVQYSLAETPDTIQPGFGILNASVGIESAQGWQLRVLANNLLNKSYSEALAGGSLGGIVRFVPRNDRRYVGVTVRKDF